MKQTILFGNGINRLSGNDFEWGNLLKKVLKVDAFISEGVPYTHQFEDIYLNGKCDTNKLLARSQNKKLDYKVKEALSQMLKDSKFEESAKIYKQMSDLKADYYMTTNYDGMFERTLIDNGYNCTRESVSSDYINIHRRITYKLKGRHNIVFWPIHGDYRKYSTMMFGFDHYCSSLVTLGNYMREGQTRNGGYYDSNMYKGYKRTKSNSSYLFYSMRRREQMNSRAFEIKFWSDLFFLTDVHIIGLGMDFTEIDLWWILNRRYKYSKYYGKRLDNHIYCYGYFEQTVYDMLKAYGVDVSNAITDKPKDNEYYQLYLDSVNKIREVINGRRSICI